MNWGAENLQIVMQEVSNPVNTKENTETPVVEEDHGDTDAD